MTIDPWKGARSGPVQPRLRSSCCTGELDTLVPAASAQRFAEGLRRVAPGPVAYAELPGGQHTFYLFHSIRFEAVVDAIEAFATWATGWREARARSEGRSAGTGRG